MPPLIVWIISAALLLLLLGAVVFFAFWIIAKAAPQEPINTITRVAVMIIALLALFYLVFQLGVPPGIK